MSSRDERVFEGRNAFLQTAYDINETGGVTVDAVTSAALLVMLDVLGTEELAAERFRFIADCLDNRTIQ